MVTRSQGGSVLFMGTLLLAALYAARVLYSGRLTFGFLLWNTTLALMPFAFAHASAWAARRQRGMSAWALAALWLVFFPNAPYLVTDFVHLRPRAGAPLWYDIALLGTAALTGLAAGGLSLRVMHAWVAVRLGARAGLMLVVASTLAAGAGIYLGRFERWNSWDLALRPASVLRDALALAVEPRAIVVTLVFAAITMLAYAAVGGPLTLASAGELPRRARSTPPPRR